MLNIRSCDIAINDQEMCGVTFGPVGRQPSVCSAHTVCMLRWCSADKMACLAARSGMIIKAFHTPSFSPNSTITATSEQNEYDLEAQRSSLPPMFRNRRGLRRAFSGTSGMAGKADRLPMCWCSEEHQGLNDTNVDQAKFTRICKETLEHLRLVSIQAIFDQYAQ